ncbi:hypothetical protein BGC_34510 [Burkholderia sp. 3C]
MRSQAALSSRRPPSTDCSASTECGGTFSDSIWGSCGTFMAWDYREMGEMTPDTAAEKKKGRAGFPGPAFAAWAVSTARLP